ncbi:MAG: hypothetical protein IJA72_01815, partial [Clostridia bacterium]|nr:hypothetical protein [Clostridia bacterium]
YKGVEYDIGKWKSKFCESKKAGKLDPNIEKQLTKLGLKWKDEKKFSEEEKVDILKIYYEDCNAGNGTLANIKTREIYIYRGIEYPIGEWRFSFVKAKEGRGGKISQKTIEVLTLLGFNWETKKYNRTKKSAPAPSGENFGQ